MTLYSFQRRYLIQCQTTSNATNELRVLSQEVMSVNMLLSIVSNDNDILLILGKISE